MIESVQNKLLYLVDSSSSQKYPFPIRFFKPEDLKVYLTPPGGSERQLDPGVDFRIENLTDYSNGTDIFLLQSFPVGSSLAIVRELDITQLLDLEEFGKLPSDSLEKALDRIVMICQQLKEQCDRAIQVGASESIQTPADILELIGKQIGSAKDYADSAARSAASAASSASDAAASASAADASASSAARSAASAAASAQAAEKAKNQAETMINQFQSSQGLGMVEIIDSVHTAANFSALPLGYRYKYNLPLTALKIQSSERSVRECEFEFVAASSGIEIEFPDTLAVAGLVDFEADGHYLINIRYGLAVIAVFSPGSGNGGTGGGDDDDDNSGGDDDDDNSGGDVSGNWGDNWLPGDVVPDKNRLAIKEVGNNSDSAFQQKYTVTAGESINLETTVIGNDIVNLPAAVFSKVFDATADIQVQGFWDGAAPNSNGVFETGALRFTSQQTGSIKFGVFCPESENDFMDYLPESCYVTIEFVGE